jgi:hypothetical protein
MPFGVFNVVEREWKEGILAIEFGHLKRTNLSSSGEFECWGRLPRAQAAGGSSSISQKKYKHTPSVYERMQLWDPYRSNLLKFDQIQSK